MAHKLDTRNGDRASGVPLIPLREVAGWEHDLHAAMDNIQDEIDLVGESAASIDAYAATDPAECFAVLSEYFFSAPELFAPRFPALWQRFCQFYQQDPLQRLRQMRSLAAIPPARSIKAFRKGSARLTVPLCSTLKTALPFPMRPPSKTARRKSASPQAPAAR